MAGLAAVQRSFEPYGPSHWVLIALLLVGAMVVVPFGRRLGAQRTTFARGFAVLVLVFQLPLLVWRMLPPRWDVAESLPLHLCDLAWPVAAYALWTGRQWAYALTYYWGLTLTPQAVVTPALDAPDFPHWVFIEFWGQHLLVVWAAVLLTWGVGMRPTWRDCGRSLLITAGWVVAVLVFNAWAGSNYGYVTEKPENPSLLDLLGGWPWYLGVALLLGACAWAAVTRPWTGRWPWSPVPR